MKTGKIITFKTGWILFLLGIVFSANSQESFDKEVFKEQLSSTIQEDIKSKIEGEVHAWLSAGEAKVLDNVYWQEMLTPYK